MGVFEGLVGGFGSAYGAHQKEAAARTAKQGELEQSILGTLLNSDNPEIQKRAMQAMIQGASGTAKKKGGISGFLGETAPSEAFTGMFDYLKGMDKSQPRGPDTVTDTVEGGVPTQTITAAPEGTPTTLFKSSEQRRLEAGAQERKDITGELAGMGASKEAQMAGAYGISPGRAPAPSDMKTIELADGVYNWDPSTGQLGERLGEGKGGGAGAGANLQRVETDKGVFAWDPQTGKIVTRLGGAPKGEGVPRDEPGYLNARAASEQIDIALEAKFGKMALDAGLPSQRPEIQAMRDELAVKFGFESYDELQRNAATRRGEMGMGMPPSAEQGISGQGAEVDHQRATEIVQAGQSGKVPTPEEQDFLRQYLEMYRDQLEP